MQTFLIAPNTLAKPLHKQNPHLRSNVRLTTPPPTPTSPTIITGENLQLLLERADK